MRFYNKHQFYMLGRTAMNLKNHRETLVNKVPALNGMIEEFIEKEAAIKKTFHKGGNEIVVNTVRKKSIRNAFEEVVMKIQSALMAADYKNKTADQQQAYHSRSAIKKLTAANLCAEYLRVYRAIKKIKNPEFYGLSREYLQDAQVYYKEFSAIKNAPALKKKENAARNMKMEAAIKDCIHMLEHSIDPLVSIAAEGDVQLMRSYKVNRKVLPRGQGRPSDAEVAYRKSRMPKKKV